MYDIRVTRSFFKATGLQSRADAPGRDAGGRGVFLLTFGRRLGEWLVGVVGLRHEPGECPPLRAGLGLFMLAGALLFLYWFGPDIRQSFRWILPGTAVATLGHRGDLRR